VVGIDRFGECGPAGQVLEFLGVTAAKVAQAVESVIA
jgi:transketolase